LLSEAGEEEQEVAGGGVGEEESVRHAVVDEVDMDLRGAVWTEEAVGTGAVVSDGSDAVQTAALRVVVVVEGSGGTGVAEGDAE